LINREGTPPSSSGPSTTSGYSSRDVWKDIYQHHLPWQERQRLGGFYTPDALVELTLDLADWKPTADLAGKALIDLSCGSGTFLVEALRRKRVHLEKAGKLSTNPSPADLDALMDGVVGLDIHPFATFLASTNVVFQVIDLYARVRRRDPGYRLKIDVFTVDALEEHGIHSRQLGIRTRIPSDVRIHHTQEEIAGVSRQWSGTPLGAGFSRAI
jgi:N-6 DNA methylase